MAIPTTLQVPEYVYKFYQNASRSIANQSAEQTMVDALSAYAAILSKDVMQERLAALNVESI